jgi:hypothetical protein
MSQFFCPVCGTDVSEGEIKKYGVCYECLNDSYLEATGGTFQPLLKRTTQPNPERLKKKEQHEKKRRERERKEALFVEKRTTPAENNNRFVPRKPRKNEDDDKYRFRRRYD